MTRLAAFLLAASVSVSAPALTSEGREFLEIAKQLEPVHCERRKLRREIVIAEVENRLADAKHLRARFADLDRQPGTVKLEKRLGELVRQGAGPVGLTASELIDPARKNWNSWLAG